MPRQAHVVRLLLIFVGSAAVSWGARVFIFPTLPSPAALAAEPVETTVRSRAAKLTHAGVARVECRHLWKQLEEIESQRAALRESPILGTNESPRGSAPAWPSAIPAALFPQVFSPVAKQWLELNGISDVVVDCSSYPCLLLRDQELSRGDSLKNIADIFFDEAFGDNSTLQVVSTGYVEATRGGTQRGYETVTFVPSDTPTDELRASVRARMRDRLRDAASVSARE